MTLELTGKFIREEDGVGLANFRIEIYAIDQVMIDEIIGEIYSDESGEFHFSCDDDDLIKRHGEEYGIYLVVYNRKGVMIYNGRYGEKYLDVKWYASPSVRFDMTFSAKEENQEPPDYGSLFK